VVRTGIPVELILVSQTTFTPHNFVLKQPDAGMVVNEDIGAGDTVKGGSHPQSLACSLSTVTKSSCSSRVTVKRV
jgi:hypothetical protein